VQLVKEALQAEGKTFGEGDLTTPHGKTSSTWMDIALTTTVWGNE
jgi:hypothetical protein